MEALPIRLAAFDLDGTLFNARKELTRETLECLARAAEAGVELVPATGRFYGAMPEALRALPFLRWVIAINGAEILDLREDRPICRAEIPWPRAVEVMERLDPLPVIYDCYMDDWGWMTESLRDRAADFAPTVHNLRMLLDTRTPVPELKAHLARVGHSVQKIQVFFRDQALRRETMAALAADFPDLAISSSIVNNMEINSRDAHKGKALAVLAAHLGIDLDQVIAFGDGTNDLTMLQTAGIGVAMANAEPEVLAAADRITESCEDSGVARELNRVLFG